MMLHVIEPYSLEKNIGKAYNDAFKHYDSNDWICLKDHDAMFLLPDTIRHIHEYTLLYPRTGIFVCYTNRLANRDQLLTDRCDNNDSIRHHIGLAKQQERKLYETTLLYKPVSGVLMVIKKSTWDKVKFNEVGCLGVDNDYHLRVVEAGFEVLRMNGVYIWHSYRLINGTQDKSHLV